MTTLNRGDAGSAAVEPKQFLRRPGALCFAASLSAWFSACDPAADRQADPDAGNAATAGDSAVVFVTDATTSTTCGNAVAPVTSTLTPNGNLSLGGNKLRQTFTFQQGGALSAIETVLLRCNAQETDTVTLTLAQVTGAGQTVLATATANGKGLKAGQCGVIPGPLGADSITGTLFSFATCVPVKAGEQYQFTLESVPDFRVGERGVFVVDGGADPYPEGRLFVKSPYLATETEAKQSDLVFRLIMTNGRSELH